MSPIAQAVEQAKGDLARGVHPQATYDRVMEENAMQIKLERERKARRAKTVTAPKI